MTALELLRRRASEYELIAEWHAERAAGDPRYGDAADALVAVAIVLREIADAFEHEYRLRGPDDHSLLPITALRDGAEEASQRFGFPVDASCAALGRLDVAAELRFEDRADGLAFLHALSLADVPWAKVGTEGKKRDRIQTVNFRSVRGRTILMRASDKGVESGVASPGELIRFERQRRYRKRYELSVSEALDLEISKLFIARELESLARVTAEVVCDQWGAMDRNSRWAALRDLGIIVIDPLARTRSAVPGWSASTSDAATADCVMVTRSPRDGSLNKRGRGR